jgi:polyisoprenoid-binding protein YceI
MRQTALILLTLLVTALTSLPTFAAWQLDVKNSQLNFISVKKGAIAEHHYFASIKGDINEQAQLNISVDLASVNTNIAIRDERMKTFLFETDKYSSAQFYAQLDKSLLKALQVGERQVVNVSGTIDFHGVKQALAIEVSVVKLTADKILVNTNKPFFIKADAFGLVAGINKLKSLASLPSINYVVPVTFSVIFTR